MKYIRISLVHVFIAWIYSTGTECRLWSNKPVYNGFKSPTFIAEYDVKSLLGCGSYCQQSRSCLAYIYFQQTCQLLRRFTTSVTGLHTSENARYFEDEEAGRFQTDALSNNSFFTYKIVQKNANFNGAVTACRNIGAHLVRLSTTKHEHLVIVIQSNPNYNMYSMWVDGTNRAAVDVTDINEWIFTNGEPVPVELWTEGQPGNNRRYCALLWKISKWNLDDAKCFSFNWYICEK